MLDLYLAFKSPVESSSKQSFILNCRTARFNKVQKLSKPSQSFIHQTKKAWNIRLWRYKCLFRLHVLSSDTSRENRLSSSYIRQRNQANRTGVCACACVLARKTKLVGGTDICIADRDEGGQWGIFRVDGGSGRCLWFQSEYSHREVLLHARSFWQNRLPSQPGNSSLCTLVTDSQRVWFQRTLLHTVVQNKENMSSRANGSPLNCQNSLSAFCATGNVCEDDNVHGNDPWADRRDVDTLATAHRG